MSKEEYSELCYLLGKLKYCYAENAIKSEHLMKTYEEISDKIESIIRCIIIDNKEEKTR